MIPLLLISFFAGIVFLSLAIIMFFKRRRRSTLVFGILFLICAGVFVYVWIDIDKMVRNIGCFPKLPDLK